MLHKRFSRIVTTLVAGSLLLTQIAPVAAQDTNGVAGTEETEVSASVSLDDSSASAAEGAAVKTAPQEDELSPLGDGLPDARDAKYHNFLPNITAFDNNSNISEAGDVGASEANAYWRTLKFEGFEGVFPNGSWRAYDCNGTTGGIQYWDDTTYKPYSGSWSGWPALGGTNGVSPWSYNYPNNACSWMIYGPFSLQYSWSALMTFNLWFQTELNYDYIAYYVSCNGYNFNGIQHSGNSNGWTTKSLSLNQCLGDPTVWIGFRFTSDGSIAQKGPFVDNIYVQEYR